MLQRREKLLRRPAVIGEVRLAPAGRRDVCGVMKVVVPQHVETEAAAFALAKETRLLRFVLADHDDPAAAGGLACRDADRLDEIRL